MINGYIYSFLTREDLQKRSDRLAVHHNQVDWFVANTAIHLFIIAMNYDPEDFQQQHVDAGRVTYLERPPLKLTAARLVGFEHFYASDADWAVMLDNDSTLYSNEQHNSGAKIFEEMEKQIRCYDKLDLFYPLNPQVVGFNAIYDEDRHLFDNYHVFIRGAAMKGSMYFMRNFRKAGEREIWPDVSYDFMEDNKLAIDAIAKGKRVFQCPNILLKEDGLSSSSFATDNEVRKANMLEPVKKLVEEYGHLGLQVKPGKPHNLEYKYFYNTCWQRPKREVIAKDEAAMALQNPDFVW